MSRIRSTNTKVEVTFRKKVWAAGFRYRLYSKKLPGKPDLVFSYKRLAVFIDGCFWHKCPQCYKKPKTNKEYWSAKIKYNVSRDKQVNKELTTRGWSVIRF